VKGLVYHGPEQRSWDSVPDPTIQEPSDIIVEIATTTICGSDLHILKGRRARDHARDGARPRGDEVKKRAERLAVRRKAEMASR
jgi:threonine dehydrogenase-like Zn-dependent dehydrogenase